MKTTEDAEFFTTRTNWTRDYWRWFIERFGTIHTDRRGIRGVCAVRERERYRCPVFGTSKYKWRIDYNHLMTRKEDIRL